MSKPIENAQEFVTWCLGNLGLDPDAPSFVAAVEARDKAIRIALLEAIGSEIEAWRLDLKDHRSVPDLYAQLRAKHGGKP